MSETNTTPVVNSVTQSNSETNYTNSANPNESSSKTQSISKSQLDSKTIEVSLNREMKPNIKSISSKTTKSTDSIQPKTLTQSNIPSLFEENENPCIFNNTNICIPSMDDDNNNKKITKNPSLLSTIVSQNYTSMVSTIAAANVLLNNTTETNSNELSAITKLQKLQSLKSTKTTKDSIKNINQISNLPKLSSTPQINNNSVPLLQSTTNNNTSTLNNSNKLLESIKSNATTNVPAVKSTNKVKKIKTCKLIFIMGAMEKVCT